MIPKKAVYCGILMASAPYGEFKVITDYGRTMAQKVAGDYGGLKGELANRFGTEFAIKTGAYHAAVATANLTFDGRGHLMTDARLGTVAPKRQSTVGLTIINDAFLDSGCRLAVICGQKSAFIEMLGLTPELIELRSCQALIVFLDKDGKLINTQVFAPDNTAVRRQGWRRRVTVRHALERMAA